MTPTKDSFSGHHVASNDRTSATKIIIPNQPESYPAGIVAHEDNIISLRLAANSIDERNKDNAVYPQQRSTPMPQWPHDLYNPPNAESGGNSRAPTCPRIEMFIQSPACSTTYELIHNHNHFRENARTIIDHVDYVMGIREPAYNPHHAHDWTRRINHLMLEQKDHHTTAYELINHRDHTRPDVHAVINQVDFFMAELS